MNIHTLATEQMSLEAMREATDFLSTKDLKWWFAALFLLFVATGIFILRLLLKYHHEHVGGMEKQLSEQRSANHALNERLLTYITTDHQQSMQTQREVADAMKKLSEAIERMAK